MMLYADAFNCDRILQQEFRSSRKLFKTHSLDESSLLEFDLFSDLEENFKEEVAETMVKTMEEYMFKTRGDYGSGVTMPKINDKDHFELKGQFFKELRDSTFSGSDHEDTNKHIEKVFEIVDLFHIPNITQDQIMLSAFFMSPTRAVNEKVYAAQVRCELCKGTHHTKGCPLKEEVKHPKGIAENVLVRIGKFVFLVDFIILDMPDDVRVTLIIRRPFLSTVHAKIDVFKRKITLRVKDEKIIFKSVKPASGLIKRVYMLSLREQMKLDLKDRLMGKTLILNRSLDLLYGDYIELNDLNVPLKLRRDQVDDLRPTNEEGEVVDKPMIEEVKTRNDDKMVSKIIGYPSDYDQDEKICIDYAYNLKFACMIVVEDMDPYLDEGMRDVVVGEPFCEASSVEARRFDGIITIRDEDDNVTYQIARSNPRFKHLTNEQCNKIPPLLKVSEQDKMNIISYPYQKLKGFYKGDLNLEPDFIRDAKMEEWLTSGHVSVHEIG
nr:hypothetical protein [Tanacetum cinerariifolium]